MKQKKSTSKGGDPESSIILSAKKSWGSHVSSDENNAEYEVVCWMFVPVTL